MDRAASEAGTRLFARHALDGEAALLASLQESLLHAGSLCVGLHDLAADAPVRRL